MSKCPWDDDDDDHDHDHDHEHEHDHDHNHNDDEHDDDDDDDDESRPDLIHGSVVILTCMLDLCFYVRVDYIDYIVTEWPPCVRYREP